MNNDRIDYLINRILSGIIIVDYKDKEYELVAPTSLIKYKSYLLYNKIINDEKYNTWIREEHMERVMIQLGLWNENNSKMMITLDKTIEDNKLKLYESLKRPDVFKLTKKSLEANRKQLDILFNTKNNFRNNTLEGYAESIKNEYIICNTLYINGKRLFENDSINSVNSVSYNFFNGLINQIYNQTISTTDIRTVARHHIWRSFWNSNKDNVFTGSVSSWTDDQRTLANYSRMYDNVYDHPDCPDDKVIEDDDILDGWFIYQKRKQEKEKNQLKNPSLNKKNNKIDNAQEVFLMVNEDQSAEEIMDLNDLGAKAKIKQRFNYLQKSANPVSEAELPDVRVDLMNQRLSQRINKK